MEGDIEQKSLNGAEPLTPPEPGVAQAYLIEAARVASRREQHVDHRAAAWLMLVDAIVLPVYATIAGVSIGVSTANLAFLVWMSLFLLWVQVSGELRNELGAQRRTGSQSWLTGLGIGALLIGLLVLRAIAAGGGTQFPIFVYGIPGLVAFGILGAPAIRGIRTSAPRSDPTSRRALSPRERWATVVIGVVILVNMCAVAYAGELVLSFVTLVMMVGYLVWWAMSRSTERLPAPGAVWAWPQWAAFAIGGLFATAALVARLLDGTPSASMFPLIGAVLALILLVTSAFLDGRDG